MATAAASVTKVKQRKKRGEFLVGVNEWVDGQCKNNIVAAKWPVLLLVLHTAKHA